MRKTREEKAITLIALIITIVVLLILAVVAINAVTGDGIIQHAVNAKTEYEKAQDAEEDMLSYYEGVLQSGQVVPTVEQLQEKYTFSYFSSLKRAIENANGTENTESDSTEENAVAGIYVDNGNKYVVLMKDTEESSTINVNQSVTINLGGKTLSLTADAAYLNFAANTTCTIDGRIGGSSIQKNINNGQLTGIIVGNGKSLDIKSGKYIMKGKYSATDKINMIILNNSNEKFEFSNASIILETNTAVSNTSRALTVSAKESVINNCTFESSSIGSAAGIYNIGKAEINSCHINVSSDEGASRGILNFKDSELVIRNSNVYADASDNNDEGRFAVGIINQGGIIKFYSGTMKGTLMGYEGKANSENYIYDSTLLGMGSVGFKTTYNTKTYIENTTIKSGEYTGKYNFDEFTKTNIIGRAIEIGSNDEGEITNNEMYMDNCTVIGEKEAIKLRNGVDLNISNSKIDGTIQVDANQTLYFGVGMDDVPDTQINGNVNRTEFANISFKGMDKTLMAEN